ncbi:hypothetical protein [Ammoniphilus sp. CFH 90114]|uniref:hypothetical protein n=1 Tax=Ammoniphilus sp. CFH 90114 TaxID=2493665 RepID=UPI00100D9E4A|nr:hypothetical protein [Ammoniphilus sp. CFH 90114]RXT07175.1 hypothetical protein EIZ39_13610 [Ammoniphilus sp. CFH 90114]
MSSLTRITQLEKTNTSPSFHSRSGLSIFFLALYYLAVFALQRGGSVEVSIGSFRFKVDGKKIYNY